MGIKPSRGRVSQAPVGETLGGYATKGALGRTVADTAAMLDSLAGYLPGDPYWLPEPTQTFLSVAQQATQQLILSQRSCRIAFATDLPGFPPFSSDCQAAMERALALLEHGGVELDEVRLELIPLIEPFKLLWLSQVAAAGLPEATLEPMNQWLLAQAPSAAAYIQAQLQLQQLARRLITQLSSYDALLLPTYLTPPIAVGAWSELPPEQVMQNIIEWIAPCPFANVTGQPAVALPTHLTSDQRPLGIQLIGQPGADSTVIALAAWLEAQLQFPSIHEG